MPENYKVHITEFKDNIIKVKDENLKVRLIGFIDEKECEALMNVEDAIKKISTAENININEYNNIYKKRFVLVISRPSATFGQQVPNVFISAPITSISYFKGAREFKCTESFGYRTFRFTAIK